MFLAAAVDAGVPLEKLQAVAAALGLHAELVSSRVDRAGIAATKIDVLIHGHSEQPLESAPSDAHTHDHSHEHGEHSHDHAHSHDHGEHAHDEPSHSHVHGHEHEHSHAHDPAHAHQPEAHAPHTHRGLPEIRQIISHAPISATAQAFALRTFELLAQAEGKIHNRDAESIHFHEVGSEDAIVDIVCSALAAEHLAVDVWYCSALNVGSGTVRCAHGVLPVPAPATAELLRGAPVFSSGIKKELLTPTGAAILRALQVSFQPLPPVTLSATGYGAGARDFPGTPNLVRLSVGESVQLSAKDGCPASAMPGWPTSAPASPAQMWDLGPAPADLITVLEANLDDMNPQLFSYVQQKLLTAGALDAFAVPVQMKKGRPGLIFTVLASPAHAELLSRILLTETTTLGVRMRQEQRRILDRKHVTVESPWGPIRVKLGLLQGEVVNCAPEFEDCRKIAEANGVPLKTVLQEASRLYHAPAAGSETLPNPAPPASSNALPGQTPPATSNESSNPLAPPVSGRASKSFSS